MDFKGNDEEKYDPRDYTVTIEEKKYSKTDVFIYKVIEWLICLVLSVGVALAIRYYIVTLRVVEQASMTPTLSTGQKLMLNRWHMTRNKDLPRGTIVTFYAPSIIYLREITDLSHPVASYYKDENFSTWEKFKYYILETNRVSYVKRIIGIAGDHIEISNGKVYLNGKLLDEPYLAPNTQTIATGGLFTDVIVPDGYVFVMGDNRSKSTDSRYFGCIPVDKIEGTLFIRFWPPDVFGKVK